MKFIKILILFVFLGGTALAQQSLSLNNALARALENNYGIVLARGNAQVATINNNWGRAGRYPYINLSAADNNSYTFPEGDNFMTNRFQGAATLNWTLFDGFSVQITKTRLEELEKLSQNNLAIMVESTIQSVILAYYDVLLQKEKMGTYNELMALSKDRYDQAAQRKEYGSAVTYDVLQAQNAYLADRAAYLVQQVAYKNSKRNLAYLMAERENIDFEPGDSFEAVPKDYALAELETQMLESNKSLQNQYLNIRLLENAIEAAKATYSPSLDFSGGVNGSTTRTKPQNVDASWSKSANLFGNFTLSWNLFNGGNRKRAVQIAEIDRELGDVELSDMHHDLKNQLANLFEFYQVRKELLALARENMEAAKLNLQISREKFESGAINSFNYRDVQQIYLQASTSELEAIYNFIDAQTSLLRLTGVIVQEYE